MCFAPFGCNEENGRDGEAFFLELFFIFFNCYINMLKAGCNLYLYQTDISSAVN